MGDVEIIKTEKKSFFKELLHRRVLQITGFYLGGGWGVLQFLDWIVERYLLSPLLVDMALTIIISLLPTIVTIAYFHGIPGKDKWRKREKILIPLNLTLAIVLVFFIFGSKDLSSLAKRVSVVDEEGNRIEQLVPRKGVVKNLTAFFFENESGDKKSDWLQYVIMDMFVFDISQDPFINVLYPFTQDVMKGFYVYQKFKDAGFPDATGAPLMLKKNIATDLKSENFMSGSITSAGDEIEIDVKIYRTRDNSIAAEKTFKANDIFLLVDDLTDFIKKVLKLPSYNNREIIDLQIKDMFTSSLKAARFFTEGGYEVVKNNDYNAAQKLFEDAVNEDTTFTIAYSQLSEIYALNNRIDKWKSTVKEMMKHLYKLPEKMQMQLKAGYYLSVKGEPEKAESILKMIIKLYPNDTKSYFQLASRLDLTGNYKEAILYYQKILELDPGQDEIYNKIGRAYENLDELNEALENYRKFSELYPKDIPGFLRIGKIEEMLGHFNKAAEIYDKALLLDPERTGTILLLAGLDIKTGEFAEALVKYQEALETSKNSREKASVYSAMENYFQMKGQQNKAVEMMNKFYQSNDQYLPPLQTLFVKVVTVDIFMKKGMVKEVKELLDKARKQLSPPFDNIVSVGYITYYKYLGELEKAESYLPDIDEFVKLTGNKQLLQVSGRRKAEIAFLRGEFDKAFLYYKELLEQDRDGISLNLQIANCLKKLGRYEEGLEYINKILKLSPYHPELNFTAGQLNSELKNRAKAIFHLELAVKGWENSDEDFEPAVKAGKMLENLRKGK